MKKIFLLLIFIIINANALNVNILYLEELIKKPPTLSNIIEEPKDSGLKGVELAIKDSNRNAKFINQSFTLEKEISFNHKDLISKLNTWISKENTFVVLNVDDALLKKILEQEKSKDAIFLNTSNYSNELRKSSCNKNLLHTIPSNAMLSDALIQFLIKRNLKDWLLIKGKNKKDLEIAKSLKDSAKKFAGNIVEEKTWELNADIRRRAQLEIPSFTQTKDYDVVLSADYYGDFGEYLYFNTWLPRPIAGTQGLKAVAWHKVIEQWGAAQLQNRFEKYAKRWMNSKDYAAWLATRIIVSSLSKTKSLDKDTNLDFMYSDKFEIGAYKGRKLSFRSFNGQLRQPIALVHPKALVSTSPQDGYLHPTNDLDTLGIASFQVSCK